MVRPWIHLAQHQILLNQAKVLATVGDVARTFPKIVTQEHTSMAFLCDRLFNIFLLYNCFIESDNFSPFTTLLYIQIDNTTRKNHVVLSKLIAVRLFIIFNWMETVWWGDSWRRSDEQGQILVWVVHRWELKCCESIWKCRLPLQVVTISLQVVNNGNYKL